jgi:hypothetical protein
MQRLATIENHTVVNITAAAVVVAAYAFLSAVVHVVVVPAFGAVHCRAARVTLDWGIVRMYASIVPTNKATVRHMAEADLIRQL